MLKVNIHVDDVEDQVVADLNINSASLADLTICERMLRRYLEQVIRAGNELLDKDTKGKSPQEERLPRKEMPKKEIRFPEREQQTEAEEDLGDH